MSGVTTAIVTGLTTTATGALDAIGEIVPVAMPVLGAVMVATIGIRVFKKIAGK